MGLPTARLVLGPGRGSTSDVTISVLWAGGLLINRRKVQAYTPLFPLLPSGLSRMLFKQHSLKKDKKMGTIVYREHTASSVADCSGQEQDLNPNPMGGNDHKRRS